MHGDTVLVHGIVSRTAVPADALEAALGESISDPGQVDVSLGSAIAWPPAESERRPPRCAAAGTADVMHVSAHPARTGDPTNSICI